MHHPEALILRRCYPVPVTVYEMRVAIRRSPPRDVVFVDNDAWVNHRDRSDIHANLKSITGALDEVYAVVDGREVRVAVVDRDAQGAFGLRDGDGGGVHTSTLHDLLDAAERAGYWERPHEVRLDLSERPISRGAVQDAVMVGQIWAEGQAAK